jgi:hypothetical protein
MFDNILNGLFLDGKTIGQAYKEARHEEYLISSAYNKWHIVPWAAGDPFYALIGDPTFIPKWW